VADQKYSHNEVRKSSELRVFKELVSGN